MIRTLIVAMLAAVVAMPAVAQQRKPEPPKKLRMDPRLLESAKLYELRESQGIGLSPRAREIARQRQAQRKPEPRKPTAAERQKYRADMAKRQQARPASPGLHTRTQAIGTTAPANAITAQARRTTATPGQHVPPPQNRMPASRPMPQNRNPLHR